MNKTITIYELLGLVKDGKAPKRVRYIDKIFNYDELRGDYLYIEDTDSVANREYLTDWIGLSKDGLNDTIEIIEDNDKLENKKMFKLNKFVPSQEYIMTDKNVDLDNKIEMIRKRFYSNELYMLDIVDKINELIDHINKIEEKLDER